MSGVIREEHLQDRAHPFRDALGAGPVTRLEEAAKALDGLADRFEDPRSRATAALLRAIDAWRPALMEPEQKVRRAALALADTLLPTATDSEEQR